MDLYQRSSQMNLGTNNTRTLVIWQLIQGDAPHFLKRETANHDPMGDKNEYMPAPPCMTPAQRVRWAPGAGGLWVPKRFRDHADEFRVVCRQHSLQHGEHGLAGGERPFSIMQSASTAEKVETKVGEKRAFGEEEASCEASWEQFRFGVSDGGTVFLLVAALAGPGVCLCTSVCISLVHCLTFRPLYRLYIISLRSLCCKMCVSVQHFDMSRLNMSFSGHILL